MKGKLKVEIIEPFNEGQEKGSIRYMEKKGAYLYESEGLVKILESEENTSKNNSPKQNAKKSQKKEGKKPTEKMTKNQNTPQKTETSQDTGEELPIYKNIYEEIFGRMKALSDTSYINIFSADDQKKAKQVYNRYFELHDTPYEDIQDEISLYNIVSFGVFMNFNLLTSNRRTHDNIEKILYVFIDLDEATQEHNDIIKQNLESKDIVYSYNAQSGGGYHFLIPVCLNSDDKPLVKGFLEYLKHNVSDKVDVATHTNERLIRCPGSFHNKSNAGQELKTLDYKSPLGSMIENNSLMIKQYQDSTEKGVREEQYLVNINREDSFFTIIFSDRDNWEKYIGYLNNSNDRNNVFIKNLGVFLYHNPNYVGVAKDFINKFEPAREKPLEGWMKKADIDNMNVNYYELLRWSKEYHLDDFTELLNKQLKHSFLDNYEFYYLEVEKSDSNILLYYPEKNYFVQKSMQEVLLNIYYDCKENAIDIVNELELEYMYPNWEEFNFKKQLFLIQDQLRRVIETENRIRKVYNINYKPTNEKIIYDDITSKKYFNIYTKTHLWDFYKYQERYHFPFINELLMNLSGNDEKNYDWFCKWLSWIIKNPTEKLPTAVILQGQQGSGKGTLRNLVFDKIFGENCLEINQTHLESTFNDYLLGKQMIVANEVMHNENRQTLPNILKNLVTDPELTINIKFKQPIIGKNYTHWIFCTNNDNPIKIDEDDRRYSVFYSEKMRKGLGRDIRSNIDYEIKDFISYLKDIEVTFEEVSEPLNTSAKDEIIELNKDSVSMFEEYISQFTTLTEVYATLYGIYNTNLYIHDEQDDENYILTDILYRIYQKYCELYGEKGVFKKQNFSKKMSASGVHAEVKWFNGNSKRVFAVSDINKKIINNEEEQLKTVV